MRRAYLLLTLAAAAAVTACGDTIPVTANAAAMHSHAPAGTVALSTGAERDVARLRAITAKYHRFDVAQASGWNAQITECFANAELGGMGFHYGNTGYIDGKVDVLEPELLLYEPQKNGRMRLVAVEYIVPLAAWTGSEPPQLFGQPFARNEAFGIWALHVWHERHNPRGMFADWNPNVTCDNAP